MWSSALIIMISAVVAIISVPIILVRALSNHHDSIPGFDSGYPVALIASISSSLSIEPEPSESYRSKIDRISAICAPDPQSLHSNAPERCICYAMDRRSRHRAAYMALWWAAGAWCAIGCMGTGWEGQHFSTGTAGENAKGRRGRLRVD